MPYDVIDTTLLPIRSPGERDGVRSYLDGLAAEGVSRVEVHVLEEYDGAGGDVQHPGA